MAQLSTCVVVGGGVVGLTSALLAENKYNNVIVLEQKPECGGLLASKQGEYGEWYDHGFHLTGTTSIPELNNLLFGEIDEWTSNWDLFPHLRGASYYGGMLTKYSPLVDIRSLSKNLYHTGLSELKDDSREIVNSENNLSTFLSNAFGPTITNCVFSPIVKKILGRELSVLSTDTLSLFGLRRILIETPEETRALKLDDKWNARIGFHNYAKGESGNQYVYPKEGGINKWIDYLYKKCLDRNVKIINSATINSIISQNELISEIVTSNGETIPCDQLIWTIALPILAKKTSINIPKSSVEFRSTNLIHLKFDREFLLSEQHFVNCWDPEMLSWRIVLYPNIGNNALRKSGNNCTVEVMSDINLSQSINEFCDKIVCELKSMKIISDAAKIIWSDNESVNPGFPILHPNYKNLAKSQFEAVNNRLRNLLILGRARGSKTFIDELLVEAYQNIEGL